MKNISIIDLIRAHILYWSDFFKMVIELVKTYNDSITILKKILSSNYPIIVKVRNHEKLILKSFNAIQLIPAVQRNKNIELNIDKDLVIVSTKNIKIKLIGGINNGDVISTFLKNEYKKLPVIDKTVVDIGSNIGDTPVYFISEGAKRVIGIEPFPKNFELAIKNIKENNYENKIIMKLSGCSDNNGHIIINPDFNSDMGSELKEFNEGIKIPLVTLEEIVNEFSIPDNSILKIDCEGCEYKIIKNTSEKILKKFNHIQIEYHDGYKDLKKRLETLGYTVSWDHPKATGVIQTLRQKILKYSSKNKKINDSKYNLGYIGLLYAYK
jgi:FkbM family methyltransferase